MRQRVEPEILHRSGCICPRPEPASNPKLPLPFHLSFSFCRNDSIFTHVTRPNAALLVQALKLSSFLWGRGKGSCADGRAMETSYTKAKIFGGFRRSDDGWNEAWGDVERKSKQIYCLKETVF
jgi:hypothetical protein